MSAGISFEIDVSVGVELDAGAQDTRMVARVIVSNVMVFMSLLKVDYLTVDFAWELKKLEARKMLRNAAEFPASSPCFVGHGFSMLQCWLIKFILQSHLILMISGY